MAPLAQTEAQRPQPTQSSTRTSLEIPRMAPPATSRQAKGQMLTQNSHPEQRMGSTTGFGQSDRRGMRGGKTPRGSLMAVAGQTRVHTPQSMHSPGSIRWRSFLSPEIARVGHTRAQAVHPMHFSVIK